MNIITKLISTLSLATTLAFSQFANAAAPATLSIENPVQIAGIVEQVDGEETYISYRETAEIEAGSRSLALRVEHQPAAGSAILLGSVANLILRAATNKTYQLDLDLDMQPGHDYILRITRAGKGTLLVTALDATSSEELSQTRLERKNGKFTRIF